MSEENLTYPIKVIGVNHRDASLDVREKLAVKSGYQGEVMRHLMDERDLREGTLISTCNRVEVYYVTGNGPEPAPESIMNDLMEEREVDQPGPVLDAMYHHKGSEAVRHLFRVASSLDSMVVGETQIINQVKKAYREAELMALTGKRLNKLFQKALALAKKIHDQTGIGDNKISVSSVAVDFIDGIFDNLPEKNVMLVGAGETAKICLEHLRGRGVEKITVCNRSFDRAEEIAGDFSGKAIQFSLMDDYLWQSDILIVATASREPIIDQDQLRNALQRRSHDPICVIDLSVPRNVAPDCSRLDQIYLYNVDDLEEVVARNLDEREEEQEACDRMIQEHTRKFIHRQRKFQLDPLIEAFQNHLKSIARSELDRSLRRLHTIDEEDRDELSRMVERIMNKIMHRPVVNLKEEYARGDGLRLARALLDLFEVDQEEGHPLREVAMTDRPEPPEEGNERE